jgi:hypothetical protein
MPDTLVLQCTRAELANPTMRADYKGQGNRIPVPICIGRFLDCSVREKGTPVSTIIGGDICTVRANGDPDLRLLVVGDRRAITVGRFCGRSPVLSAIYCKGGGSPRAFWMLEVSPDSDKSDRQPIDAISPFLLATQRCFTRQGRCH